MTISEINQSIMFGNWTNDQLNSMIMAVKFARAQLGKQNKRALQIGATVKFVNSRTGQTITGTVQKIAVKNVSVKTPTCVWRVPANMVEMA